MDNKVTLDVRSILIAGLVLLGLILAYLVGSADDDPATAAAPEETAEEPRALVMVGAGEVSVVPDQLAFTVAVNVKRADVSTAFEDSSRVMDRVLGALKPYGVERADMQSTGLSIDPDYRYFNYQPPRIVGYRVSQRARITVSELKQAGEAISAAVHAGGNAVRVHGISLQVSDRESAMQEARKDAVAEARAKAEQYAEETGQDLGAVLSLSEVRASGGGRDRNHYEQSYYRAAALDAFKYVPIRAGEEELKVRVRVVWSFA